VIARFGSHLNDWRQLTGKMGMTTRLVLGFCVLIVLALLALSLIIFTAMRARMYRTADVELGRHAHALQALLQNEEVFMTQEARDGANLDGLDQALQRNDTDALKRLFTPNLVNHDLSALYVIDPQRRVLAQLGAPMMDDAALARLPLVSDGFDSMSSSGYLGVGTALWLSAVAAHRSPEGNTTAVVLLGKRLDQAYLQPLRDTLGLDVALVRGNTAAYSFTTPPPELPVSHLQAAGSELAEYRDGAFAYHSMSINQQPYRVAAYAFPTRDGGEMSALLFQPAVELDDSIHSALLVVDAISLLILVTGAPLAYLYARSVTQPLDHLALVAKQIARGDLKQPVAIQSRDEVGQLAAAFEEMRVQVRGMLQAQQQWNAELEEKVRAKTSELQALCEVRDQLLQETLTAQEEERRRVARELHDETCQSLTALLANMAAAELSLPADSHARLGELRAAVVTTLQEVNRIVLDLRPTLLDDYGLVPALSWYAGQRLPAGTRVEVGTVGSAVRLPSNVETVLFRIGQEAIANIGKYARASRVQINLLCADGEAESTVTLQIEDDGCGFDADRIERYSLTGRRHLGLVGMEERVGLVGGRLEMRSAPGKGTRICATVPLGTRAAEEERNG
jgi:signal transduction histidine kinase